MGRRAVGRPQSRPKRRRFSSNQFAVVEAAPEAPEQANQLEIENVENVENFEHFDISNSES